MTDIHYLCLSCYHQKTDKREAWYPLKDYNLGAMMCKICYAKKEEASGIKAKIDEAGRGKVERTLLGHLRN